MGPEYDALDIERLVESSFDAFCTQFGITGRAEKQKVLAAIAATARELKGRQ